MEIIWLVLYYSYSIGGYYWLSHQETNRHFMTSLDKYIPTIPIFIIPYFMATIIYTLFPLFIYFTSGWDKTKPVILALTIANTLGFLFYAFWNTSVVREAITGTGFFDNMLRWLHSTDRPSAAFPSGHVYSTIVVGYFCMEYFPKSRPYVLIFVLLVIIATVVLKQHYLPDILGGIVIALISIFITKKFIPKQL